MEVYFKDLISKEASLEKLVDDLTLVVQGADDFAKAIGANVSPQTRDEVVGRLENLRRSCERIRHQTVAGAKATDKYLRAHPYTTFAAVFAIGLLIGTRWSSRK
jgi:ElaB/YqjD/DUF883 family membrane-anchored ribosome-binding protein